MLWYLPLEYIDKRYTVLMDKQLCLGFGKYCIDYTKIVGRELVTGIKVGAFLDSDGTNYFKFSQLETVAQLFSEGMIKHDDVFFVSDLWFPGLISIPYMSMFHGIKTHIVGMMHAGSWTDTDYVNNLKDWARDVETGWFKMVDQVFVGSEFHKQDIISKGVCSESDKIHVTGLPFSVYDIVNPSRFHLMKNKQDNVIFAGRLDDEKQPFVFDDIKKELSKHHLSMRFIKTIEQDLDKNQYFNLLANSKVIFSAALQENYGYSILEAVALGCTPVVPNRLSYIEMYPKCFRYDTFEEAVALVYKYIINPVDVSFIAGYYDGSVNRMMSILQSVYGL